MDTEKRCGVPVIIEEKPSITAHAVRTLSLADDTPVRSETTSANQALRLVKLLCLKTEVK